VGPFGLGDGDFDSNVIHLPVIVSSLPLVVKIGVGAPNYCKDCVVGGKGVSLLHRFADL
jgi:hypothetical protein